MRSVTERASELGVLLVTFKVNPGLPSDQQKYLSKVICYGCNEIGHYKRDCPKFKEEDKKKRFFKKMHHAHATEDDASKKKAK